MKKRMLSLCLAVLMLTLAFTGCGETASSSDSFEEVSDVVSSSDNFVNKYATDGPLKLASEGTYTVDGVTFDKIYGWVHKDEGLQISSDNKLLSSCLVLPYFKSSSEAFEMQLGIDNEIGKVLDYSKTLEKSVTRDGLECELGYILKKQSGGIFWTEYLYVPSQELEISFMVSCIENDDNAQKMAKQVACYLRDSVTLVALEKESSSSEITSSTENEVLVLESDGECTTDGITYTKLKGWNFNGDSQSIDNLHFMVQKIDYYKSLTPQESFSSHLEISSKYEEVVEHSKRVESFTTKDGKEAYSGYILTYLAENYYCDEYIIIPSEELEIVICGSAHVYEFEYETEAELEQAKQTVPEHLKQVSAYIRNSISLVPSKNTDEEEETSSSSKDTSEVSSSENAETTKTTSITRGTINGNVYESKATGVKFTKPDNWVFASDEELAAVMNISNDYLYDSDYLKELAEKSVAYDVMAQNPATGTNVGVAYQNMRTEAYSEQDYLDSVEFSTSLVSGVEFSFDGDAEWTTICGHKYLGQKIDVKIGDVNCKQVQYVRKIGKYVQVILFSVFSESEMSTLESMFK
ncbi:MAG: hypothetical protein IJC83_05595 [Oscillospiraceae bacterium]|nr:hypothetical protein [Oscillospiraceae bacterium]